LIPLRSQHANIATVLTAQRDQVISGFDMVNICPDFIVSSFKEACQNNEFHHRWMTADTWAKVIVKYYKLSNDVAYNGKQIVRALALRKYSYINKQMQADPQNVPKDQVGIFRLQYRPKVNQSFTVSMLHLKGEFQLKRKVPGTITLVMERIC